MKEEKVINGNKVRRSKIWPNYGCSKDGLAFRWESEKPMAVGMGRGSKTEYPCLRVSHNCKASWAAIHVMVAECWIDNDDPTMKVEVNHKNGNKSDYSVDNLEWSTKSQNQRHAINTGLKGKGEDLYNAQLTETQVHLICQKLQQGALVKDLSDEFEVSKDIIRKIRDGSTYFHIRTLYPIDHNYKKTFSESTVRWVCEQIVRGVSDKQISLNASNKDLVTIEVKRIRNKIRYKYISDEYF